MPEATLEPFHTSIISLVIVTQQVQETVEGEHSQLGQDRVAPDAGLAPRHAPGDCDVPQETL